jgi:Flp pilus assembly protein TadB
MEIYVLAAVVGFVVSAVAFAFLKGQQSGRAQATEAREREHVQVTEAVRKASEAAAQSDRDNTDPERLRADDGFKRRS